jgi:integrase
MWQPAWVDILGQLGPNQERAQPLLRSLLQWVHPEDVRAYPSSTTLARVEAQRRSLGAPERLAALLAVLPAHPQIVALLAQPLRLRPEEEPMGQSVQWNFSPQQAELWRTTGLKSCCYPFSQQVVALALQQHEDFHRDFHGPDAAFCLQKGGVCACLRARLLLAMGRVGTLQQLVVQIRELQQQAERLRPFLLPADRQQDAQQCYWSFLRTGALQGKGRRPVARMLLQERPDLAAPVLQTKLERLRQKSDWHRALLDQVSCEGRTSYPEQHRRAQRDLLAQFLWRLETEVGDARDFLQRATPSELGAVLVKMLQQLRTHAQWVVSSRHTHHARRQAHVALSLLNGVLRPHVRCDVSLLKVPWLLRQVPNLFLPLPEHTRRTFTDQEVERMLVSARNESERLLITLLREVALRYSALVHLRYSMLVDEHHKPRSEAHVPEKAQSVRAFPCSTNLQHRVKLVAEALRKQHPDPRDCFLLNARDPSKPFRALRATLRRMARNAGIHGVRVHPHAFRHTLVGKLMAAGNSMELVSKLLGHRDAKTTSCYYFRPSVEELRTALINPFQPASGAVPSRDDGELELLEAKLRLSQRVLELAQKHCDLSPLRARLPELDQLLQEIYS